MSSVNVVRVKRKADEEPVEALVIALKRSKIEEEDEDYWPEEVVLKLATTYTSGTNVDNDFLRNALTPKRIERIQRRQSPKDVSSSSTFSMRQLVLKVDRKFKRDKVLADRRLILAEDLLKEDEPKESEDTTKTDFTSTEVRGLFKLYDIIEESEESKSIEHDEEKKPSQSSITCNGVPLLRVNGSLDDIVDYVYDVYYVTDGDLDDRFVESAVSVQPVGEDLVYESDEPEEYYEDEDDSNDECNWRNDYPEEEDSDCGNYQDDYENDENMDPQAYMMLQRFRKFAIDEEKLGQKYKEYKERVLAGLESEDDFEDF